MMLKISKSDIAITPFTIKVKSNHLSMSSTLLYIFYKIPSIHINKTTLKYKKLELIFPYVIIKKTKKGDNWE